MSNTTSLAVDAFIAFEQELEVIYNKENIPSLKNEKFEYLINGENMFKLLNLTCFNHPDYHKVIQSYFDEIDFISDDIQYYSALMFFTRPQINDPIKDVQVFGGATMYPYRENIFMKRYQSYALICFEKLYNIWSKIAGLWDSYFNFNDKRFYITTTFSRIDSQYRNNIHYNELDTLIKNSFTVLNEDRKKIVHTINMFTEMIKGLLEIPQVKSKIEETMNHFKSLPELVVKYSNESLQALYHTLHLFETAKVHKLNQ